MLNQDITKYRQDMNRLSHSTSVDIIKKLYQFADLSLMAIANSVDMSEQADKRENQLLEDKDRLILIAADVQCRSHQDLSQKIDLLHTAYLKEKTASEFSPTDVLLMSIWETSKNPLLTASVLKSPKSGRW